MTDITFSSGYVAHPLNSSDSPVIDNKTLPDTPADTVPVSTEKAATSGSAINSYRNRNEQRSITLNSLADSIARQQPESAKSAQLLTSFSRLAGELRNAQALEAHQLTAAWNEALMLNLGEEKALSAIAARGASDQATPLHSDAQLRAVKYPLSSWELGDSLADAIGQMEDSYLEIFQQAVQKLNEFFTEFSKIVSQLSNYISAKDDKIVFNTYAFRQLVTALITKFNTNPPNKNATLYPPQSGSGTGSPSGSSYNECAAWANQMGLPETCIKQVNGKYVVTIDAQPLNAILGTIGTNLTVEMNSAQWAAWQSGFDQQKSNIQTSVQTLVQKYSSANSTYENLVKVLSSTISNLLEVDKSFFNV